VATSAVPTNTPQGGASGDVLPGGTLVLLQNNQPIAQLSGGRSLTLSEDRFGTQGSPDGRYGMRFAPATNAADLVLLDYASNPPATKDIPNGKGLTAPTVIWKDDSSGFAFYDFPLVDRIAQSTRTLFYYDLGSGQSRELVKAPAGTTIPAAKAFSPDGRLIVYTLLDIAQGEGATTQPQVAALDLTSGQQTPLPAAAAFAFNQWLKDSSGFLVVQPDQNGRQIVQVHRLNALNAPVPITPADASDRLLDLSPDGRRIIVAADAVSGEAPVTNLAIMNLDGSNRKVITQFTDAQQSITQLFWGNDGIYYSTFIDNADATWRVDLDGRNATQLAPGILYAVIGAR
jgi:hypothetical protein